MDPGIVGQLGMKRRRKDFTAAHGYGCTAPAAVPGVTGDAIAISNAVYRSDNLHTLAKLCDGGRADKYAPVWAALNAVDCQILLKAIDLAAEPVAGDLHVQQVEWIRPIFRELPGDDNHPRDG